MKVKLDKLLALTLIGACVNCHPTYLEAKSFSVSHIETYTPCWENITAVSAFFDNVGNALGINVIIMPKSCFVSSKGKVELQKYSSGSWKTDQSWSFDQTGTVKFLRTVMGVSGTKYRIRVSGTVGGESFSRVSKSVTLN